MLPLYMLDLKLIKKLCKLFNSSDYGLRRTSLQASSNQTNSSRIICFSYHSSHPTILCNLESMKNRPPLSSNAEPLPTNRSNLTTQLPFKSLITPVVVAHVSLISTAPSVLTLNHPTTGEHHIVTSVVIDKSPPPLTHASTTTLTMHFTA